MSEMHAFFSFFQFLEYRCIVCLLKELKLPGVQKGENPPIFHEWKPDLISSLDTFSLFFLPNKSLNRAVFLID